MNEPFKLCILRLSAIGDVCHAIAMVTAIRAQKPNVEITWVIGKIEYELAKYVEGVNFVVYDKKTGRAGKKTLKKQLEHTTFDALFVMQVALRANLLSRAIKAKRRIGFDSKRAKEGHSLFINERIDAQQHAHVLEGFMGFAKTLGVSVQSPSWQIDIPEQALNMVAEELSEPFVVICPAASKAERSWTAEGYAKLIDYIASKGYKAVLCGGPGKLDNDISEQILAFTSNVYKNMVGKTSLIELLAVLKHAKVVVAPDTGPAHMATTQRTPVVGLYAHSNPRRTGPYLSLVHTASVYEASIQQQTGKHWQDLPWGKRAKGDTLMQQISFEQVCEKMQDLL